MAPYGMAADVRQWRCRVTVLPWALGEYYIERSNGSASARGLRVRVKLYGLEINFAPPCTSH